MLWATRLLDVGQDLFILELFEAQRATLGMPRDMMLVAIDKEGCKRRLFIGVPDEEMLNAYYGFQFCLRRDLPKAPVLIAGPQDMFQAMFQSGG